MILHHDCQASLCDAAADGADHMIVDPPYSPDVHSKATSCGVGGLNGGATLGARKRDFGFEGLTPELLLRICYFASRVRRWSVVFSDAESTHLWRSGMAMHGVEYVRSVPWIRWSQPQLSGDRPPSGREEIMIFHRAEQTHRGPCRVRIKPVKKRWNGPGNRIEYRAKSLRGADKHPTEKPLDLMLALVSDFTDPGEFILDPLCGRGTTLLAARLLGRAGMGIELNRSEALAAEERASGRRFYETGLCMVDVPLAERDRERVARFAEETYAEASAVPEPKAANGSDVKTYERAQRRLADVERILKYGS